MRNPDNAFHLAISQIQQELPGSVGLPVPDTYCPRALAVAVALWLERWPTRFLTGHVMAINARKPCNGSAAHATAVNR